MIKEKIKSVADDIALLEGTDKLTYLIDLAKQVEALPDVAKTDTNKIHGCASNLWIIGGCTEQGTMRYQPDADAFITKGTAKLVTDIVNDCPKQEVAELTVDDFKPLGIRELLTPQRQNGLGRLIERIVAIAKV